MISPEGVIILDSSRSLSESEVHNLFANCGEIRNVTSFSLPPNCLRDFPGLSQYFIEFADESAARRAVEIYLPPNVIVDILLTVPELIPLFASLRASKIGLAQNHRPTLRSRKTGRISGKKGTCYESVVIVCCKQEQDESDIISVFSTCGEIKNVHPWKSARYRKRRFFIEFASAIDAERARRGEFPGLDVLGLAQKMGWAKHYKKLYR